jgi:hypothetical protein
MSPIQQVIDKIRGRHFGATDLRRLLAHASPVVRVNAIDALQDCIGTDDSVVADLVAAATEPANAFRLMGTITVAHQAVLSLLQSTHPKAVEAANELIRNWPEPDRQDLLWFLRSEGCEAR